MFENILKKRIIKFARKNTADHERWKMYGKKCYAVFSICHIQCHDLLYDML